MTQHDFRPLYVQYPIVIDHLKNEFTSHEFIRELAQQNQLLYIEALYTYRNNEHRGTPAPFRIVHMFLAQHLSKLSTLVEKIDEEITSFDIFGRKNKCAKWRKIN